MTFEIGVTIVGWVFASIFAFMYLLTLERLDKCRINKKIQEGE